MSLWPGSVHLKMLTVEGVQMLSLPCNMNLAKALKKADAVMQEDFIMIPASLMDFVSQELRMRKQAEQISELLEKVQSLRKKDDTGASPKITSTEHINTCSCSTFLGKTHLTGFTLSVQPMFCKAFKVIVHPSMTIKELLTIIEQEHGLYSCNINYKGGRCNPARTIGFYKMQQQPMAFLIPNLSGGGKVKKSITKKTDARLMEKQEDQARLLKMKLSEGEAAGHHHVAAKRAEDALEQYIRLCDDKGHQVAMAHVLQETQLKALDELYNNYDKSHTTESRLRHVALHLFKPVADPLSDIIKDLSQIQERIVMAVTSAA